MARSMSILNPGILLNFVLFCRGPASPPNRAFSSEVDAGSREENASKQKDRAPFRFNRNGKGSSAKWRPVFPATNAKRLRGDHAQNEGSGHMSFVSTIIGTAERVPLPDVIIRAAIHRLCSRTATRLATGNTESDAWFADEMAARAIAEYTDEANAQHYEVPAAFFARVLGPNRKYSSCFYNGPESTLQEAEEEALRQTVAHAD